MSTPEHVRAELRRGHGGRAVAAAEVEDVHPCVTPSVLDERLAALAHASPRCA